MLTDAWRFYRKYANVKDTDEYWQAVVNECRAIPKKYGDCKFSIDLSLAVLNELERIGKEIKENGQANT